MEPRDGSPLNDAHVDGQPPTGENVERTRFDPWDAEARDIEGARKELAEHRQQLQVERKRLQTLRRRLKRRWHRHWTCERAQLSRREAEIADERLALQAERERHRRHVADLRRKELRFNAETELSRRHLRADRNLLAKRRDELAARERTLKMRESAATEAEHRLVQAQQQWQAGQAQREREIQWLETRIANQRVELSDLQETANRLQRGSAAQGSFALPAASAAIQAATCSMPTDACAVAEESLQKRTADLEHLADVLTDQRAHLAEQLERFALAQHRWNHERAQTVTELEALAPRLRQQEQILSAREEALEKAHSDAQRRQAELWQQRRHLEAWQARLTAATAAWQGERDCLRAEVHEKEEAAMETEDGKLQLLVEASRLQRVRYEQQLRELREEVERLARVLLDESDVPAVTTGKAA